jgi:hypothetical protein
MKIEFNESENSIEIKDGLKNQYLILKIFNDIEFSKRNNPNIWKTNN